MKTDHKSCRTVLLTGAKGMLAADVMSQAPREVRLIPTDIDELDITDAHSVLHYCRKYKPDVILNCAGYTNVDGAETDSTAAFAINETGPKNLANACHTQGIRLVHISTDFVFRGDGSHPLSEDDVPMPRGVYAQSKRAGECVVEQSGCSWLIVRTSWLYGLHGKNFPDTILRLASEKGHLTVVNDQKGTPTFSRDLAAALWRLIAKHAEGYVHFSNAGACTWYGFAVEIVRQARELSLLPQERTIAVVPVTSDEFKRPAPRPAFSVMSTEKYAKITGNIPRPWHEALHDFLTARKSAL